MWGGKWVSLIEMGFVYGVVLALAIWQLVSVKLEIRRDKKLAQEEKAMRAAKERASDPPAE